MREEFESLIYNEKLLVFLYRKASALATLNTEKNILLTMARKAEQNIATLNYYYRQEYGTNYDPIIPESKIFTNYRDLLEEIEGQELDSFLKFSNNTQTNNSSVNNSMRLIADDKVSKILVIQSILISMNSNEIENLEKKSV